MPNQTLPKNKMDEFADKISMLNKDLIFVSVYVV